jgi:excinuclease ABC subunit C
MPGNDRYIYVCLGRKPAPFAFATRDPTGKELAVFGPLKGAAMTNEAVRRVNDLFRLRDCAQTQTMHFAEQRELFPVLHTAGCLRYELGTCLGPCAAFTTQSAYARHVRAARAFLDGTDVAPLERLQKEMQTASDKLQFEKAAALRDKLTPLQWVRERLNWLSKARVHHSFVYPLKGADGETLWYVIHRGRICRAVLAPTTAETRRAAAEAIAAAYDGKNLAATAPIDEVDHVLLVAAWFRKFELERSATLSPEKALEMCRPPKPLAALCPPA